MAAGVRVILAAALWLAAAPAAAAEPLCNVALPQVAPGPGFDGAEVLGTAPPPSPGAWVWLNVWATWCKACVEELPLLRAWQAEVGGSARLSLLLMSVDAERAPVEPFLLALGVAGPAPTTWGSLWLPPGPARGAWLDRRGFSPALTLPLHALYDPDGRLRCLREGAVEPALLPALKSLMSAP